MKGPSLVWELVQALEEATIALERGHGITRGMRERWSKLIARAIVADTRGKTEPTSILDEPCAHCGQPMLGRNALCPAGSHQP